MLNIFLGINILLLLKSPQSWFPFFERVVGIPVIEIAMMAQQHGIKYVGMRNEQSVIISFK